MSVSDHDLRDEVLHKISTERLLGELRRRLPVTISVISHAAAVDGGGDFITTVKAARDVWMAENPAEDGRDHVTPFDRFLYATPPVAQVQQDADRG